jgi:hypothetical protein
MGCHRFLMSLRAGAEHDSGPRSPMQLPFLFREADGVPLSSTAHGR